MKIYDSKEAAEYVGLTAANFRYHVSRGKVVPARTVGRSFVFVKKELDRFRAAWEADGMTKREISAKHGISPSLIQYYMKKGTITPLGKRKNSWVFDPGDVEELIARISNG